MGVEELMTLEDEDLKSIEPIYGLIFLFKWKKETEKRETLAHYDNELFFAKQVINNACATQALLSILMNRTDTVKIGEELTNIRNFTMGLSAADKGGTFG